MSTYYREHNRENAVLLMEVLGRTKLPFSELSAYPKLVSNQFLGRLTTFYADGTVKTFFLDTPDSEDRVTPREPTQEELDWIVPHLRGILRGRVIEDLIDERMRKHALGDPSQEGD